MSFRLICYKNYFHFDQMQANRTAIQLIGFIISKETLDVNSVLDLIQILNSSPGSCRDIITILQDIFKHEKSSKILVAVSALQYMVKNCNHNFHNAANRQSFQKRLLSLLNRIRGKTSIIKQLNSNTDNWCRIEAKVLYVVQLWYDAFILDQAKYSHIINTYKTLRKENITFPPRSKNQKNLMLVATQSPIFDNIEQIAYQDQKKFNSKLKALGMGHLQKKMERNLEIVDKGPTVQKKASLRRQVNIDQISEKIGIIQSTENCTLETLKVIEEIKKAIEYGVVKPNQQGYWKELKAAAEQLVEEWQTRNAELVKQEQQKYLQKKLGMMVTTGGHQEKRRNQIKEVKQQKNYQKIQEPTIDLLDQVVGQQEKTPIECPTKTPNTQQFNLIDL